MAKTYKASDFHPSNMEDSTFWMSALHYAVMHDVDVANRIIKDQEIGDDLDKFKEYDEYSVDELYDMVFAPLSDNSDFDDLLDMYNSYGILDAAEESGKFDVSKPMSGSIKEQAGSGYVLVRSDNGEFIDGPFEDKEMAEEERNNYEDLSPDEIVIKQMVDGKIQERRKIKRKIMEADEPVSLPDKLTALLSQFDIGDPYIDKYGMSDKVVVPYSKNITGFDVNKILKGTEFEQYLSATDSADKMIIFFPEVMAHVSESKYKKFKRSPKLNERRIGMRKRVMEKAKSRVNRKIHKNKANESRLPDKLPSLKIKVNESKDIRFVIFSPDENFVLTPEGEIVPDYELMTNYEGNTFAEESEANDELKYYKGINPEADFFVKEITFDI